MEFKPVKIETNDPQTAATFDAMQKSIVDMAKRIPNPEGAGIVEVNGGTYTTNGSEKVILVDSRGGQVKIVLQAPRVKQTFTVIKQYDNNSLYVVTIDGKPIGNGGASIEVDDSLTFTSSGSQWWRHGS